MTFKGLVLIEAPWPWADHQFLSHWGFESTTFGTGGARGVFVTNSATLEYPNTIFHHVRGKHKQPFTFWYCVDNFYPWKDIVGKKVSKLRSIPELRAFYGSLRPETSFKRSYGNISTSLGYFKGTVFPNNWPGNYIMGQEEQLTILFFSNLLNKICSLSIWRIC
jgi:hypothetical protein